MASSNEPKNKKIEKKETAAVGKRELVDESKKGRDASSTKLIDGRIFEADVPMPLTAEEKAELAEFEATLKHYNNLSREQRKQALQEEREELSQAKKSPKIAYYEETRQERIKIIDAKTKIIDEMEKKFSQT